MADYQPMLTLEQGTWAWVEAGKKKHEMVSPRCFSYLVLSQQVMSTSFLLSPRTLQLIIKSTQSLLKRFTRGFLAGESLDSATINLSLDPKTTLSIDQSSQSLTSLRSLESLGLFLSFGGMLVQILQADPWLVSNTPGLLKILQGAVFPVGLVMIVLFQVDLVTASQAIFILSTLKRKVPIWAFLIDWSVCLIGNLAGGE